MGDKISGEFGLTSGGSLNGFLTKKLGITEIKVILSSIVLALSFQATDISIANIKIGELIFLLSLPFILYNNKKMHKVVMYMIIFLFFVLIVSLFINFTTVFYLPNTDLPILKQPYFITVTRIIEVISCISMIMFLYNNKSIRNNKEYFLNTFFFTNVIFSIVFIFLYILSIHDILNTEVVYGENRLRGLYVEGGPLGLYYAFLFLIGYYVKTSKFALFIFLVVLYLAQSKAGILLLISTLSIYYLFFKIKSNYIRYFGIIAAFGISIFAVSYIAANYVEDIKNVELLMQTRSNDNSFVMGRIAGLFIGSEMIYRNPFFGIGFGNYSLVRNDPSYLGLFPPVDEWDLTGLGIFTLIVETGIVGFLLFSFLTLYAYSKTSIEGKFFVLLFYITFFFGVQFYFLYPWFALSIALVFYKKRTLKNAINNRL